MTLGTGLTELEVCYGGLAQLVEHLLCKQRVKGSNPLVSTNVTGVRTLTFLG